MISLQNELNKGSNPQQDVPVGWRKFLTFFKRCRLSEVEAILFAFSMVMGNRCITWNTSLAYGFPATLFNILFVGSAFVCLSLCMGEMSSALPFSGGIFGFVRAVFGPSFAYVTASLESTFIVGYNAVKANQLMNVLIALNVIEPSGTPYCLAILYGTSLCFNLVGGKPLWIVMALLGFFTFTVLLIYSIGSLASVDSSVENYQHYCVSDIPFTFANMMGARTGVLNFFQGVQFIPLLSDSLREPTKQIPRVMITCSLIFLISGVAVTAAACSEFPGIQQLTRASFPLSFGFSRTFSSSFQNGIWMNAPALYATAFASLFSAGKQLHAIAKSGLLFDVFTLTTPVFDTPWFSYLLASCVGFAINLYIYYNPIAYKELRNVTVIESHIVFFAAFCSYIGFRYKYSSLARPFTNPLGIWGAVYGILNYLFGLIGLVFFSGNTYYSVYATLGLLVSSSVFYWSYMVKYQKFSEEEKELMFKAYLINANRNKRQRILKNNKVGVVSTQTNSKVAAGTGRQSKSCPLVSHEELSVNPPTPNVSLPDDDARGSYNIRHAEDVPPPSSVKLSERILNFLSSKMNSVMPAERTDLQDYCQMAVLSSGGIIDDATQAALSAKLGLDIESSVEVNN